MTMAEETTSGVEPGESDNERWNRNFGELLQELRVAQTGVQILFGFLLSLPFTNRFGSQVHRLDRWTYLITLVAAAAASAFLIAPASYHRLVFRQGRKAEVVGMANRMASLGLICLLIAVAGGVFLASDVVFHNALAGITTAVVVVLYLILWYALPLLHKRRHPLH
jgi:hypothetical protein